MVKFSILCIATLAVVATAGAHAQVRVDPSARPRTVTPRKAVPVQASVPAPTPAAKTPELVRVLASYNLAAIVGASAILQASSPQQGMSERLILRSGRPFDVAGVLVTPTISEAGVSFTTPASSASPFYYAALTSGGGGGGGGDGSSSSTSAAKPPGVVVATAAVQVPAPVATWDAKSGASIRSSLKEWSDRAGWQLVWALDEREDYRLMAGNNFSGDFKMAVTGLFNSLPLDIKVRAELRPDNTPPMIYITRDEGIR